MRNSKDVVNGLFWSDILILELQSSDRVSPANGKAGVFVLFVSLYQY